jgi:hypothetical protein
MTGVAATETYTGIPGRSEGGRLRKYRNLASAGFLSLGMATLSWKATFRDNLMGDAT